MRNLTKTILTFFIVVFLVLPGVRGFCQDSRPEDTYEDTIEALINMLREKKVIGNDEADRFIERYRKGISSGREKGNIVTIIPEQKGREYIEKIAEDVNSEIRKDVSKTKEDLDFMTDELLTRSRLTEKRIDDLERVVTDEVGSKLNKASWTNRIRWGGDIRLRYQSDMYDDENYDTLYDPDRNEIINTTTDVTKFRYRVRLQMEADVMEKDPENNMGQVKMGVRLATGNIDDPVSTNDTLADYFNNDSVVFERAFVQWTYKPTYEKWGHIPRVTATAGRFANPWFFTNLVWDRDVNFEGMAVRFDSDTLLENPLKAFLTAGAFPLQEINRFERDKWLYAGQIGVSYDRAMGLSAKLGIAYYDYQNITGRFFNDPSGSFTNQTEPLFRQVGNALFDINTDPNHETYALAGEYRLFNITARLDYDYWFPYHVILDMDYVKNVGFNAQDVAAKMGLDSYPDETQGYQIGLTVGYPVPRGFGEWNVSLFYKYLGADAVLDAFTDSDFHLGGTNAEGWILSGQYGLSERIFLSLRWLSSNEIRAVPISIDRLLLDLNVNF